VYRYFRTRHASYKKSHVKKIIEIEKNTTKLKPLKIEQLALKEPLKFLVEKNNELPSQKF
jgi:hypothetical protein